MKPQTHRSRWKNERQRVYHRSRDYGYVFSRPLKMVLMSRCGLSSDQAENALDVLGQEALRLVLEGKAYGLPDAAVVHTKKGKNGKLRLSVRLPVATRKYMAGDGVVTPRGTLRDQYHALCNLHLGIRRLTRTKQEREDMKAICAERNIMMQESLRKPRSYKEKQDVARAAAEQSE